MLVAASVSGPLTVAGVIVAIVLGFGGASAVVWAFFRASTGNEIIKQQSAAIEALQATINDQDRRLSEQGEQIEQARQETARMRADIARLEELVTQAAKVDDLIVLVKRGFAKLGAQVETD